MMQSPIISLGLPVYNGAKFLSETLNSLVQQTFEAFTLTILDNASTDATEDICRDYLARDSRIRYRRQPVNVGLRRNFNEVFHVSEGKYFKWCTHDDVMGPTYLERCLEVLETDGGVVLCQTEPELIDEQGSRLLEDATVETFLDWSGSRRTVRLDPKRATSEDPFRRFETMVCHTFRGFDCLGVIRRDVLKRTRLVRAYFGSDLTLLAELSLYGRFYEVPEPLYYKREHVGQARSIPTAAARAKLVDPRARRWQSLVFGRRTWALSDAVLRSPVPLVKKLQCLGLLAATINWGAPLRLVGIDVRAERR